MKKLLFMVAFLAIGFGSYAQSSIIKTSPGALAFGNFNACYEKVLTEKSSIQFSGSAFFGFGDADVNAFGVGVEYRMYVTRKEAPNGFYVMPRVGLAFGDASALSVGVNLGYQWVWDSGFVLDVGLGPQYFITLGDSAVSGFDGILPAITLAVGYAF